MDLKASVAAVVPGDSRERSSIEHVLTELERLPRPLDRDADPVHVTASALIANEHGVVLHLHKLIGLWLQPGGHIDPGEAPSGAALREAIEETGLPCRWTDAGRVLFHVDVHPAARGHTHLDLRYLLTAEGEPSPARGESKFVRWFMWDDAIAAADPGLIGAPTTQNQDVFARRRRSNLAVRRSGASARDCRCPRRPPALLTCRPPDYVAMPHLKGHS